MIFNVYHCKIHGLRFWPIKELRNVSDYDFVGVVRANDLEDAFMSLQFEYNEFKNFIPVDETEKYRSLSVGDILARGAEFYAVDSVGFSKLNFVNGVFIPAEGKDENTN